MRRAEPKLFISLCNACYDFKFFFIEYDKISSKFIYD